MDDRVAIIAKYLVRVAFVALMVTQTVALGLVLSMEWLHSPITLSKEVRSVLVFAASAQVFLFLVGLYFYEHTRYIKGLSRLDTLLSSATCFLLLLPAAYLVFRFDAPEAYRHWIVSAIAIPWVLQIVGFCVAGFSLGERSGTVARVTGFIRLVMLDHWNQTATRPQDDKEAVAETRPPLYIDKESILAFQKTLSCQIRDSAECAKRCSLATPRDDLRILDIGGCEGDFTSCFIKNLNTRGHTVVAVTNVDPAEWETEYRKTLDKLVDGIDFQQEGFESYEETPGQFDIVLASHSLYAVLDLHRTTDEDRRQSIQKLIGYARPGGYAFIILAAPRARSYCFKERALGDLLGFEPPDATSNTIDRLLTEIGFESTCVDNVMQMTRLLKDFRGGKKEGLIQWLSYFLRIDCTRIDPIDLLELHKTLCSYIVRCDSLSEKLCEELTKLTQLQITTWSEVLPHKSMVYFWQKPPR